MGSKKMIRGKYAFKMQLNPSKLTEYKRWWAHMADIMQTHPNNEPVVKPLLTVFQMD